MSAIVSAVICISTVHLMILLLNLNSDNVRLRVMFASHAIFSLVFYLRYQNALYEEQKRSKTQHLSSMIFEGVLKLLSLN